MGYMHTTVMKVVLIAHCVFVRRFKERIEFAKLNSWENRAAAFSDIIEKI
jgi:hypothetical protein